MVHVCPIHPVANGSNNNPPGCYVLRKALQLSWFFENWEVKNMMSTASDLQGICGYYTTDTYYIQLEKLSFVFYHPAGCSWWPRGAEPSPLWPLSVATPSPVMPAWLRLSEAFRGLVKTRAFLMGFNWERCYPIKLVLVDVILVILCCRGRGILLICNAVIFMVLSVVSCLWGNLWLRKMGSEMKKIKHVAAPIPQGLKYWTKKRKDFIFCCQIVLSTVFPFCNEDTSPSTKVQAQIPFLALW